MTDKKKRSSRPNLKFFRPNFKPTKKKIKKNKQPESFLCVGGAEFQLEDANSRQEDANSRRRNASSTFLLQIKYFLVA